MDDEQPKLRTGLPPEALPPHRPGDVYLAKVRRRFDVKRTIIVVLGLALFFGVAFSPPWPDAIDPVGKSFELSREGKLALGVFLLAATYWVFEVVPIGVTSILIGVLQALFLIRPARVAFTDFMAPSVWFIFGSIVPGVDKVHVHDVLVVVEPPGLDAVGGNLSVAVHWITAPHDTTTALLCRPDQRR